MRHLAGTLASGLLLMAFAGQSLAAETKGIDWQAWSPKIFDRAKAENKLVLLDMEAVWCHWCHVMDEKTYADRDVQDWINQHYLPVRVDQDANPDLSVRYGDWGWPATIIFSADGSELGKFRGFIPPDVMNGQLQAFWEDPTAVQDDGANTEAAPSKSAFLTDAQRAKLMQTYVDTYDTANGAWGRVLKFINADMLDYAVQRARDGDKDAEAKARQTLDAARKLVDPVWGGAFQYSDKLDWSSPHFEKIMTVQRDYLKAYSAGYALFGDEAYKKTAFDIYRYLTAFRLSPEGAFYTSQNADVNGGMHGAEFYALDDAARRASGQMPDIDKSLYARENGWAVSGLVALYNVSDDKDVLATATHAAEWVVKNRALDGGGFAHGDHDRGGPFLGDTLAMGRAELDLYGATGDRRWLKLATEAADFIDGHFRDQQAGFVTAVLASTQTGVFVKSFEDIEENIAVARFANVLNRVSGQPRYRDMAAWAMHYLTSDEVIGKQRFLAGIISADQELAIEPAHVTVIGSKADPVARQLYVAARALPLGYLRLDWWDRSEGPLPNPDVDYPELDKAAVFACANQICSLPMTDTKDLLGTVRGMLTARIVRK